MILCECADSGGKARLVRIRDLSECGLKIAIPDPVPVGTFLRIRLPRDPRWLAARVVWWANGTAGIAFMRAVDLPEVPGLKGPTGRRDHHFEQAQ